MYGIYNPGTATAEEKEPELPIPCSAPGIRDRGIVASSDERLYIYAGQISSLITKLKRTRNDRREVLASLSVLGRKLGLLSRAIVDREYPGE